MQPNEIGHFPFRKRGKFDKGSYPRFDFINDKPTWVSLGEVEVIEWPKEGIDLGVETLVYDLQSADDAFCANDIEINGIKYIYLYGSGWAIFGFPFFDDSFDPKNPYKTGNGCYALLRGEARLKFLQGCEKGNMDFLSVTTGNIKADFVLPEP